DAPWLRRPGVQGEGAPEHVADPLQDADVLDAGVGVPRRHDAARAQVGEPDHRAPDIQVTPFPAALGEPADAAEHDVWAQAAAMAPSVVTMSGSTSNRPSSGTARSRAPGPAAARTRSATSGLSQSRPSISTRPPVPITARCRNRPGRSRAVRIRPSPSITTSA